MASGHAFSTMSLILWQLEQCHISLSTSVFLKGHTFTIPRSPGVGNMKLASVFRFSVHGRLDAFRRLSDNGICILKLCLFYYVNDPVTAGALPYSPVFFCVFKRTCIYIPSFNGFWKHDSSLRPPPLCHWTNEFFQDSFGQWLLEASFIFFLRVIDPLTAGAMPHSPSSCLSLSGDLFIIPSLNGYWRNIFCVWPLFFVFFVFFLPLNLCWKRTLVLASLRNFSAIGRTNHVRIRFVSGRFFIYLSLPCYIINKNSAWAPPPPYSLILYLWFNWSIYDSS